MKWERIQERLNEEYYFDETEGELNHSELRLDMTELCAFCFDAGRVPPFSAELDCKNCKIDHNICDGVIYRADMDDLQTFEWVLKRLKEKYDELEKKESE